MGREDVLQNRSHTMAIQQDWSKCERFSNFTAGAQERVMSTAESEGRSLLRSTAHVSHFPMAVEASQRQVAMGHSEPSQSQDTGAITRARHNYVEVLSFFCCTSDICFCRIFIDSQHDDDFLKLEDKPIR